MLNAIGLYTGEYRWRVMLGEFDWLCGGTMSGSNRRPFTKVGKKSYRLPSRCRICVVTDYLERRCLR